MALAFIDYKDGVSFTGGTSAMTNTFTLLGGRYVLGVASASWSGGTIQLQQLQPDASTYVPVTPQITQNFTDVMDLPPGTYQFTIVTATGVLGSLIRVPYRAA